MVYSYCYYNYGMPVTVGTEGALRTERTERKLVTEATVEGTLHGDSRNKGNTGIIGDS